MVQRATAVVAQLSTTSVKLLPSIGSIYSATCCKLVFVCLLTRVCFLTRGCSPLQGWEMDSENPEDFGPALILAEEDQQEIGGLINSDGEEVDFSDLSEQIIF